MSSTSQTPTPNLVGGTANSIPNSIPISTTTSTPSTTNTQPSTKTQPSTNTQLSTTTKSSGTASSSISSPSAAKASTNTQNLSPGAIAGIGIGCAVIASLLTVAIMLLLRRKQSKSHTRHSRSRTGRALKSNETEEEDKLPLGAIAFANPKPSIDTFLPQQADDAAIRQKVLVLFDQVELHVDNFYADNAVQLTAEQEAEMSRFGTPTLSMPLAALLEASKRKTTLIKHCLAFYVVGLVSPTKRSRVLLPYELATMLAVTNQRDDGSRVRDQNTSLAISRWRMLTAYLRPDLFSDTQWSAPEEAERLQKYALSFSQGFAPFSAAWDEDLKVQHLVEVLRTAVKTALWLLTQPSVFDFDWTPTPDVRDRSGRAVVTVPALWKTHDQNGGRLDRPQVLQAGTTRLP